MDGFRSPTLQVPGHPEIYVVGDMAHIEADGSPLPMVAQVAIQSAVAAAENIGLQIAGRNRSLSAITTGVL